MTLPPAIEKPPKPSPSVAPLIQLILSAVAAVLLLGVAAFVAIQSYFNLPATGHISTADIQPFMVAASLAFAGALLIPSAWYALRAYTRPEIEPVSRPESRYTGLILTLVVLVVVGGSLLLGNWVAQNDNIAWFVLPFLNIIVTGLPALWVIYFGTRGLLPNRPRYKWGVFAGGLVLGPSIILVLELIMLLVVVITAVISVALNPSLSNQLSSLVSDFQNGLPGSQTMINDFMPFLLNPFVIFIGLASVSVLVPIIEETFKPIGVWFMAGQKITPAQGFGYGVLSGAAFGLFENLGNTSSGGADWALLAGSRISTLLLHSFTAGLMGWALASAWTQRRFLRLAVTFCIAIAIHGLWNGMAVLSAAGSLSGVTSVPLPAGLQQIGLLATIGIFALGLFVLVLFFGFNSVLRHGNPAPQPPSPGSGQEPNIPPPPPEPPVIQEPSIPISSAGEAPRWPDNFLPFTTISPQHFPLGETPSTTTETTE